MSLIARTPALGKRAAARFSTSAARRSGGHHEVYEHIPFDYSNKTTFGLKVASYLGVGFGIPFFAAWWQLRKAGA